MSSGGRGKNYSLPSGNGLVKKYRVTYVVTSWRCLG